MNESGITWRREIQRSLCSVNRLGCQNSQSDARATLRRDARVGINDIERHKRDRMARRIRTAARRSRQTLRLPVFRTARQLRWTMRACRPWRRLLHWRFHLASAAAARHGRDQPHETDRDRRKSQSSQSRWADHVYLRRHVDTVERLEELYPTDAGKPHVATDFSPQATAATQFMQRDLRVARFSETVKQLEPTGLAKSSGGLRTTCSTMQACDPAITG